MKNKFVRQIILPLLTAIIWGTAFVFQSKGAESVGPFTFNALRSVIASLFLGVLLLGRHALARARRAKDASVPRLSYGSKKDVLLGGFLCGTALTIASYFQQAGLGETAPDKGAFITALYVVLVPLIGLLFGKKVAPSLWISVAIAVVGLYFLCIHGTMGVEVSDLYVLACAFCFAGQILIIDRFTQRVDGMMLSFVQFVVVTLESALGMLLTEQPSGAAVVAALGSVLYVGVFSSGVAYTLQIISQKGSNPTVVSLLFSLESFFATVATVLMLGQWMSGREMLGAALMLVAVVLSQIPPKTYISWLGKKKKV